MMKSDTKWVLLAVASVWLGGCVAQKSADDLLTLNRTLESQIIDLQAQLEEAEGRIAALQAAAPDPRMEAELEALRSERDQLREALAAAEQQLREAGSRVTVIPESISTALEELARRHPGVMSYDPEHGMVRFRSDLTFSLGSAEVRTGAQETLRSLASILNSADASGFEVRIVGHTDNVPITKSRDRHPTNWHLSVHRAISVMQELRKAGVPSTRMSVMGYGEHRPVVPNGPQGAEANRRVEIYLVSMTPTPPAEQMVPAQPADESTTGQAPADEPVMYK